MLNFKSQNNEDYTKRFNTKRFNLDELVKTIQLSHGLATGSDEIPYQTLKHLQKMTCTSFKLTARSWSIDNENC